MHIDGIVGDPRNLGAEFFPPSSTLWITDSDVTNGNTLHEIDPYTSPPTLLNSYLQGTTSAWGMRDLANDGTYLYAGDDNGFYQIDPTTGGVTTLFTPTGMGVIRALARDPVTGHFFTKSLPCLKFPAK